MFTTNSQAAPGFAGFELSSVIQRGIAAAGFINPRPIQAHTIPAALEGRDILGLAQTGTGKTAAFALPVLERLLSACGDGPRTLIVAPTRELASQISEEIRMLAKFTGIRIATVFGGVSTHAQIVQLRKRPDIIVACPGRLLDLFQQGALCLNKIDTLVLDEADHMFDMGFLPDIRRVISALPKKRQNLLFSATMPAEIRRLADTILLHPHVVELDHSTPVPTVSHLVYPIGDDMQKFSLLEHVLSEHDFVSAIIFTRTKHRAKRLAEKLERSGHNAVALQGNMSQVQRVKAMEGFRKRHYKFLVATDIAARGIDVEQISHVVNFDAPDTPDAYTHRIGRTGRAERAGKAITFITSADQPLVRAIESKLGQAIPRMTVQIAESAYESRQFRSDRQPQPRSEKAYPRNRRGRRRPSLRRAS
ncbi:MAG: DEAD/DEAH box helicase [Acidobacteriota bacterium]